MHVARKQAVTLVAALLVMAVIPLWNNRAAAAGDSVDEIHSSYGNNSSEMWVYWHGTETQLSYGLTTDYDSNAAAGVSTPVPVDIAGPFEQVKLTGLTAGQTYHYRIGADGLDHTFQTAPTGDFTWDDIGDTGTSYYDPTSDSSCNKSWMPQVWQQIAADNPAVVTHGGDISYANECGQPAVHQFWNDIAPIAQQAPIQFALGNHEYGAASSTAPYGTPRDSLANYKGRYNMANAQTVPNDTSTQVSNPGCPSPTYPSKNGCQGDDWGYFTAGHTLFISYPEPWVNAYADWKTKADALMAQAETDPNIYFIVTYGHRPANSSQQSNAVDASLQSAVYALGDKYSPAARPDGKYVMSIGHHVHSAEAFSPQHGVVILVDGGGGSEEAGIKTGIAGSQWFTNHISHLRVNFVGNQMTYSFICGPVFALNPSKEACTKDSVLFSQTISGYASRPPVPAPNLTVTHTDGTTNIATTQDQVTYATTVTNSGTADATNVILDDNIPTNATFLSADDGVAPAYGTVEWAIGTLPAGQSVTKHFTVQASGVQPGGTMVSSVNLRGDDPACTASGSVCYVVDTDTMPSAARQWLTNPSFESNTTGWANYNTSTLLSRITTAGQDGVASLQVTRTATGSGVAGVTSKPASVASVVAGTTYTGTVWLQPQVAGQSVTVELKETNSAGTLVQKASTVATLSSPGSWQKVTLTYTAKTSGDQLYFNVYGGNIATNNWFRVDNLSLTTPN